MAVRIIQGDCLERLRQLPDNSVHCCVTSPPYYGLRDYGVPGQIGLDPFAGSGTVGEVALGLSRHACLIELNPEYIKFIERRCHVNDGLPL